MASFGDDLASGLRPYLGTATKAYVESLAAGVGKSVGSLGANDITAIEGELRRSVSAVGAASTIEAIHGWHSPQAMTTGVAISKRTWISALVGALGLVAFAFVVFAPPADPGTARYLAYLDDFFIVAAAIVILRVAVSFSVGKARWRQWMLIGLGVASFAIGDIVWAFSDLVLNRTVPTPGLPDVFYVITTVLLAVGVIRAAIAFRRVSISMQSPLVITSVVMVALVLGECVFVLRGVVSDPALSLGAKALNVYYPLADLALLLGPALFIVLVVRRLGTGALGWPWWVVAAGLACMSIADIAFSKMQIIGSYAVGSPVDIGWMAGYVLLAIGALIAYDIGHPVHHATA